MELDLNKATQPYEYYLKFIKQNVRPDMRRLSDIRACNIRTNCISNFRSSNESSEVDEEEKTSSSLKNKKFANQNEDSNSRPAISSPAGSAIVKLGSTNVVCGITARLCKPRDETPNHGFVICNVELPALCSSKTQQSTKTASSINQSTSSLSTASVEQSQAMLSQLMQDVLAESGCVRTEDLCLKPGKLVWCLYVDIICLNNDGNVQDACCLAMVSALRTCRLMELVECDPETGKTITEEKKEEKVDDKNEEQLFDDSLDSVWKVKEPFSFHAVKMYAEPVCTTLFSIEDDNIVLSDPNKREEDFMRTYMVVCTLNENQICLMRKYGGLSLSESQMSLCLERALQNGTYVRENVFSNSNKKVSNFKQQN